MSHDQNALHASAARASDASATGFELTEQALAALLHGNSRAALERWLEAPLSALERRAAGGTLDLEVAAELRSGLQAALELFAVLEREARASLSSATGAHSPR